MREPADLLSWHFVETLVADPVFEIKSFAANLSAMPARLLFPPVCAGCRRQVSEPGTLCGACWPKLRFLERPWCAVMGTPFAHDMGDNLLSAEAIADPPPFDRLRSVALHDDLARQLVHGLKYRDRTDLAPMMAGWMVRASEGAVEKADIVLAVPLHASRLVWRKFNQAAELARAIAAETGKPFLPLALRRTRRTRHQVGLGARQREDNVRGAFTVTDSGKTALFGRRVVLVDDVYTTGATVSAATRALKRAGVADVTVLTFARALPGPI